MACESCGQVAYKELPRVIPAAAVEFGMGSKVMNSNSVREQVFADYLPSLAWNVKSCGLASNASTCLPVATSKTCTVRGLSVGLNAS